jgi:hypothetical protein
MPNPDDAPGLHEDEEPLEEEAEPLGAGEEEDEPLGAGEEDEPLGAGEDEAGKPA